MTGGRRVAVIAAGGAVVVVLGVLALRPAGTDSSSSVSASSAPAFTAVDLDGHTVSLSDYKGKPVLLNFWASWCVPCRKEFPLFKTVDQDKVAVLGVVFKDTPQAAAAFAKDEGATWPSLKDAGSRIADAYGVGFRPGLPVTVLVDKDGRLAERHIGELRRGDLDHLLALARA